MCTGQEAFAAPAMVQARHARDLGGWVGGKADFRQSLLSPYLVRTLAVAFPTFQTLGLDFGFRSMDCALATAIGPAAVDNVPAFRPGFGSPPFNVQLRTIIAPKAVEVSYDRLMLPSNPTSFRRRHPAAILPAGPSGVLGRYSKGSAGCIGQILDTRQRSNFDDRAKSGVRTY